jgi:hypothetical protein
VLDSLPERSGTIGCNQSGPVPAEEPDTELGLECPDAMADGGGCDVQLGGGPREAAVPDARREHSQRLERWQGTTHAAI